jgi:hypothetical protein
MTSLPEIRARCARNQGLPFADVLTEASPLDVLTEHGVNYRERAFSPVTTIRGFLSQVLSEDPSCRDTGSRIIAQRAAHGLTGCSPNTASCGNARSRLRAGVLSRLAKRTAQRLQASVADEWKWHGRRVFVADGAHVSLPDTPANQARYPPPPPQQPGLGFPLARPTVLLSLASGGCHDLARAAYAGTGTGETTLLRAMDDSRKPGDVVLADALFDNHFLIRESRDRGLDLVARAQYQRVDSQVVASRPDGDIILWQRPNKPRGMTGEQYRRYPETMLLRQVPGDARDRTNRAEQFHVITTILDAPSGGGQFGDWDERRWDGEVDIRSIKSTRQMDILRCQTPAMVGQETWAHLLAYNRLRTAMAVAASANGIEPRPVSFQGAKQALTAFAPKVEAARPEGRAARIEAMLRVMAYHRVGDRPGRWEPRARKRRPKPGARRTQPRAIAKRPPNRFNWF